MRGTRLRALVVASAVIALTAPAARAQHCRYEPPPGGHGLPGVARAGADGSHIFFVIEDDEGNFVSADASYDPHHAGVYIAFRRATIGLELGVYADPDVPAHGCVDFD